MLASVDSDAGRAGRERKNGGGADAWVGASEREVEIACLQISRRLLYAPFKVVAFLPAAGAPPLLPLLVRVARGLFRFEPPRSGVIGPWRGWDGSPDEPGSLDRSGHAPVLRPLPGGDAPDLIVPPRAPDADTALLSLQLALRRIEGRHPRVLLDLTGWADEARSGLLETLLAIADGAVVVGTVGRTRVAELRAAAGLIPAIKTVGVVLLGAQVA
jgi:hypothetical protein